MIITEQALRKAVRQVLLKEIFGRKITINMSNDARVFSSRGGQYVHRPTELDPVIRKITKIVDKDKKNYVTPVLDFLKNVFVKDAAGNKRAVASTKKDEFMSAMLGNYVNFANTYAQTGEVKKALDRVEIDSIPDIPEDAEISGKKALVRNKETGEYEIKSHGQGADDDIMSAEFENIMIDGLPSSGSFKITELFRDILAGQKVLKVGAGRKWIKGKNPEDQLEWMQVKALQGLLISMGHADGLFTEPDGDFGSKTRSAVQRMQRALGLSVDGAVGQQTASALNPKIKGKEVPITGAGELSDETKEKLGL